MSGSLIDDSTTTEENKNTEEAATSTESTQTESQATDDPNQKLDPFNDADGFKDEKGLYLGKYKTIPEVMKGYKELSGKLREKNPEAPESYQAISFKDDQDIPQEYRTLEINAENDPLFKEFEPTFKAGKFTQEQVNLLVKNHFLYNIKNQPDLNKEREKLGEDADKILSNITRYRDKRNTPAMKALAQLAGQNGDMLKELNILIGAAGEKGIPGDINNGGMESKSPEEWDADAREYKKKYGKEMDSGSKFHQDKYYELLGKATKAKKLG